MPGILLARRTLPRAAGRRCRQGAAATSAAIERGREVRSVSPCPRPSWTHLSPQANLVARRVSSAGSVVRDQRKRARGKDELGIGVRSVRTTFLPPDETVLHVFEAPSDDAVRRAARHVELRYQRIVEALEASAESPEEGTQ